MKCLIYVTEWQELNRGKTLQGSIRKPSPYSIIDHISGIASCNKNSALSKISTNFNSIYHSSKISTNFNSIYNSSKISTNFNSIKHSSKISRNFNSIYHSSMAEERFMTLPGDILAFEFASSKKIPMPENWKKNGRDRGDWCSGFKRLHSLAKCKREATML